MLCFVLINILLFLSHSLSASQTHLTPLDFGLSLMEHGMVDYCNTPPNILCGNFNSDDYPDIARFEGNRLEIFLFMGKGYWPEPQGTFTFEQPIQSLHFTGSIWNKYCKLTVVLQNGSEEILPYRGRDMNLSGRETGTLQNRPPRRVSEAEFQLVWESESKPFGMDELAVGDLDNDGIEELVTWWKEYEAADSAWILIYKCVGDDEFELFMEEPFDNSIGNPPEISYLLITDLDQNGQRELIYTYNKAYIWEFEAPGIYNKWDSNYYISRAVHDAKITDVDQDNIPEIATVCTVGSMTPPTFYLIKEFGYKNTNFDSSYMFINITNFSQDWPDYQMDVGDFDNDGAIDIVSGNFGYVTSYDPVDIQYYRFDLTAINNFTQHWLSTGIPLSCANPAIEDLDSDGQNELFAGGLFPNGGSSFIWEPTGFQTGYVSWLDTTHMVFGPNESAFGMVDANPSVVSQVIFSAGPHCSTILYLFGFQNGAFSLLWQSEVLDSLSCHIPTFYDIDGDDKLNLLMTAPVFGVWCNWIIDWEQTSAGIWEEPYNPTPQAFNLQANYPNPFNSTTVIPFELSRASDIRLSIYDISGRIVHEYREESVSPGHYSVDWDASGLSSGIYLIELVAGGEKQVRKGVLLK